MSKQAVRTLRYWKHEGPRIIIASFTTKHKGINLNIIQAYAPTNEAAEEDKDCFYNQLQSTVENFSKKDVNILMGDMNAKVGTDNTGEEEVMGIHGIGQVNDNGERFKGLCGFNQLVIEGTIFPYKTVHKASWVSPDGRTENQIDHFTISKKFRRSLQDVRVMRGADIGSDHHLLVGKVKIKLKGYGNSLCKEGKRMRFQVNLLQDPQKRQEFHLELKNRFELLGTLEDLDVGGQWEKVKEVMKSTCSSVLGEQRKPGSEWITLES